MKGRNVLESMGRTPILGSGIRQPRDASGKRTASQPIVLFALDRDRTGAPTIPEAFMGGEHLRGATDTFEAFKSGTLQETLKQARVALDPNPGLDPCSLPPNWLHSRKRA